jgi:hypothetical protein
MSTGRTPHFYDTIRHMKMPDRAHILAQRTADCPSAAALEYANAFFSEHEGDKAAEVRLPLRAFGLPFPDSLAHPVRFRFTLHEDVTEQGRAREEIAFAWNAGTRWLPNFHGTLRVHIAPQVKTALSIEGWYAPPFGIFGKLFDRVLGRKLAQKTVESLLDQIAERMENEQRAFKFAHRNVRGT